MDEAVEVSINVENEDRKENTFEVDMQDSLKITRRLAAECAAGIVESAGFPEEARVLQAAGVSVDMLEGMDIQTLKKIIPDEMVCSAILANIRKRSDVKMPPPVADGKPVQVQVLLELPNFGELDTIKETFDIRSFVDLVWKDPRLIGVHEDHLPDFAWKPNIYVYNSHTRTGENDGIINKDIVTLTNSSTGEVTKVVDIDVQVKVSLDLKNFPFDENPVRVTYQQDNNDDASMWEFQTPEDAKTSVGIYAESREMQGFTLRGFSVLPWKEKGVDGCENASYTLIIHVARNPTYYIWKSILPLILTTGFAFTCFVFDPLDTEERTTTAQTSLLTTIALIFVLASDVPKTGYLTLLDKYVVVCLAVQTAIWLLSCAYTGFDDNGNITNTDKLNEIDAYIAYGLLSFFILITTMMFGPHIYLWLARSKSDPPMYSITDQEGEELPFHSLVLGENLFSWGKLKK